jgi:hypothetical protein
MKAGNMVVRTDIANGEEFTVADKYGKIDSLDSHKSSIFYGIDFSDFMKGWHAG